MEEIYGIWSLGDCYSPMILAPSDYPSPEYAAGFGLEEEDDLISELDASCMAALEMEEDIERVVKSRIKCHPQYPRLLQAYVDFQKVGAPGEVVGFLDGIMTDHKNQGSEKGSGSGCRVPMGVNPELDNFMETYIEMLMKYREDLERPLNEANAFLEKTERQLSSLCNPTFFPFPSPPSSDEGSDEELCHEDVDAREARPRGGEDRDRDLKDRLLQRFGRHISTLKMEFSKKRKKGKLPQEARQMLLHWWNAHNKWPYPTEADKITLAESTGLDQKQINNWFINQRKRHWIPSESIQFALKDDCPGQFRATD